MTKRGLFIATIFNDVALLATWLVREKRQLQRRAAKVTISPGTESSERGG